MDRVICGRCGKTVLSAQLLESQGRRICGECYAAVHPSNPKCWECIFYLRDDHDGYCKRLEGSVVDGCKDACPNFMKP